MDHLIKHAESNTLPPVSIIMAVYNGERYLAEAIESVLCQTHRDFEFVIVNDGSTDRTQDIIDRYATRDGRIRSISQANADQPASLNRALATASNDWVALLDADDVCMPHRLETQLRVLQRQPSVRVLGSYAIWLDPLGQERGIRSLGPTSVSEFEKFVEQDRQIFIVHPSALMHRPTILALGSYDPAFGAAADAELWSRVSDKYVIMSLPEPLLYYRFHAGSMSVTRFFEQRLMLRWIQARQDARRRGFLQPTFEEYVKSQESRLTLRQLGYLREDWIEYLRISKRLESWKGRRLRALLLRMIGATLAPRSFVNQPSTASKRRGLLSMRQGPFR